MLDLIRANWNLVLPKKLEKLAPKKGFFFRLSLAAYVFSLVRANWDLVLAKILASKNWGLLLLRGLPLSFQQYDDTWWYMMMICHVCDDTWL